MNIKAQFLEEIGNLVVQNLEMGCSQVSDALGRRKGQVDTEVKQSDAFAFGQWPCRCLPVETSMHLDGRVIFSSQVGPC